MRLVVVFEQTEEQYILLYSRVHYSYINELSIFNLQLRRVLFDDRPTELPFNLEI